MLIRKLLILVLLLSSCTSPNTPSAAVPSKTADIAGLSEAELQVAYPNVAEVDGSFSILVSKNLHPYHPPQGTKFLRFGTNYLVAELRNGKVIALHHVGG